MSRTYPDNAPEFKPGELDDLALHSIGRLIRATAEIEDIIDHFISSLTGLSEAKTVVMLGKTAVTRRIGIAEMLAKLTSDEALAAHKEAFSADFGDILYCRNAVAHGVLLGITSEGDYAFRTTATNHTEGQGVLSLVVSYNSNSIAAYADKAEGLIAPLEESLRIRDMREASLRQPLSPHPKTQDRGRAKQQRPPPPSEG